MTEKVRFERRDHVPVPLIYLDSPELLANWYVGGLLWALEKGERALGITCFDTAASMGFDNGRAAQAVLRAVMDVLYEHPEAESLTILCGDEASWQAYRLCWNMWYAEYKPPHED